MSVRGRRNDEMADSTTWLQIHPSSTDLVTMIFQILISKDSSFPYPFTFNENGDPLDISEAVEVWFENMMTHDKISSDYYQNIFEWGIEGEPNSVFTAKIGLLGQEGFDWAKLFGIWEAHTKLPWEDPITHEIVIRPYKSSDEFVLILTS